MSELVTEIQRKATHVLWGLILTFAYHLGFLDATGFLVIFLLTSVIILSYRATRRWKRPLFALFFDTMERPRARRERFAGASAFQYHLAFLLLAALFPSAAAITGMVVMTLGDPFALWYGVFLGRVPCPWNRKKDLDARIVSALVTALFLLPILPFWQGLVASLAGMLAESFDYKKRGMLLDDNLVVPLVAAIVLVLV